MSFHWILDTYVRVLGEREDPGIPLERPVCSQITISKNMYPDGLPRWSTLKRRHSPNQEVNLSSIKSPPESESMLRRHPGAASCPWSKGCQYELGHMHQQWKRQQFHQPFTGFMAYLLTRVGRSAASKVSQPSPHSTELERTMLSSLQYLPR